VVSLSQVRDSWKSGYREQRENKMLKEVAAADRREYHRHPVAVQVFALKILADYLLINRGADGKRASGRRDRDSRSGGQEQDGLSSLYERARAGCGVYN